MKWKRKEDYAKSLSFAKKIPCPPVHIGVIGAGDVGRNLLLGLRLLGTDVLSSITFWEPNLSQQQRILHEIAIIRSPIQSFTPLSFGEDLFATDVVVFAASGGVPPLGQEKKADVRLLQYGANAAILRDWVNRLEANGFEGMYFILSDPVDFLCRFLVEKLHISSKRIVGFGQGVMYARAALYGGECVHIYGPHGAGLWVANNPKNYDPLLSEELTHKTRTENILVRNLGFKPFIAPAFSSGALSILSYLRSETHYASHFVEGLFWGELYHPDESGWRMESIEDDLLFRDILKTFERCDSDGRQIMD